MSNQSQTVVLVHGAFAESATFRGGRAAGACHALSVSQPEAVTAAILEAVEALPA